MSDEKPDSAAAQAKEDGEKEEKAGRRVSASSTEAGSDAVSDGETNNNTNDGDDDDHDVSQQTAAHILDDKTIHETHSQPDLDHDEIEAFVPGHQLDVELGKAHNVDELKKIETRGSVRSKVSKVLSVVSRRKTRERIPWAPIPESDLAASVVGWDGQADPAMPLNFPSRKKWMIVGLLSVTTLLTPFASSILAPGIEHVEADFNVTNTAVGTLSVSIYLLGYVVGPLFLAPLSEIYGRKPVLGAANFFFCVWQIGCALAPSMAALIVFRFLAGVGGAGCLTLGAGVISDVFRTDERGFAIGIYTLGPLLGPTIGPIIGGFIAETIGWRWDFWLVLIAGGVVSGLTEIFNQETNPRVLIDRKVKRLKTELGRDDLRSCYDPADAEPKTRARILLNGLIRPSKMLLLSPIVFFLSLYIAFVYGVLYLLFTTIPVVFQEQYHFNVGIAGLVYICMGLGFLSGWAVITATSDRMVVRATRLNNGVFEPEMRLPLTIYFGMITPITFFWYGWSAGRTHWIVPIIGLFPFSFGIIGIFMPIITYLVDTFPMYAASANAANTVLRSLVGALLPLAGPQMYDTLGLGWGNSLLGFICIAMIPVPLIMYRYGAKIRKMGNLEL